MVFDQARSVAYDRRAGRLLGGFHRRAASGIAAAAPRDGAVLDIGTGPGRLLHAVATLRPDLRLSGADLSPDMVALARRAWPSTALRPADLRVADVGDLPWPDGTFDVVTSTLSAHEWPDQRRAAAELVRVLRPGGLLLVWDFRFARVGALVGALAALCGVRRKAPHPLSPFTRVTARRPV
ncbi:class I SAM-dependent methyltransferase [Actinoplanes sp. NBRC 101535]|uniref:class I SAM-dependent methyltransferase n=1 Tax=Actinoplanes sp. NBRC 101535 TaxID=3032196 RepID=UPI0024A33322|nr:class I SAM-dependent methyltransferase [Actinoplanes sp. NBRC 101535]GLY02596.1 hypothetical protein Acsp01_29750 [Actinoplanes sp. NBRC 101535]